MTDHCGIVRDSVQGEPSDNARRLAMVRVTRDALAAFLKTTQPGKWIRCDDGLPPDAELVGLTQNVAWDEFELLFRSSAFKVVAEGCPVPTFWVSYASTEEATVPVRMIPASWKIAHEE